MRGSVALSDNNNINGDGTHSVPVHYICKSALPNALKGSRFSDLKSQYSQANGWMDTKQLTESINRWYNEVRILSDGPWCLVMDKCGGNELNITFSGVEIIYFPPRSASKHRPLDLGLIANEKIRYQLQSRYCKAAVNPIKTYG